MALEFPSNPYDFQHERKEHAGFATRMADQRKHGRAISMPVYDNEHAEALGLDPTNPNWNEGWDHADATLQFEMQGH